MTNMVEKAAAAASGNPGILIEQSSYWGWLQLVGWLVLFVSFLLLLVNFVRQFVLLKRPGYQTLSENISSVGIAFGWFSLMIGIAMTWYGLHCTWYIAALLEKSLPEVTIRSIFFENYAHSFISGFVGLLIWAGAFFESALFRALWLRKK